MTSPKESISQFVEPWPLRVGMGIYLVIVFLAEGPLHGNKSELLLNVMTIVFGLSLLLVFIGAGQVVIRNEKLHSQTPGAKMRRFYLYFVLSLVGVILTLPVIFLFLRAQGSIVVW